MNRNNFALNAQVKKVDIEGWPTPNISDSGASDNKSRRDAPSSPAVVNLTTSFTSPSSVTPVVLNSAIVSGLVTSGQIFPLPAQLPPNLIV